MNQFVGDNRVRNGPLGSKRVFGVASLPLTVEDDDVFRLSDLLPGKYADQANYHHVPGSWADNFVGDPTAVEVTGLCAHALAIDEALAAVG